MLYSVKTVHNDGSVTEQLIKHVGPYTVKPSDIKSCSVNVHKYRHEHVLPPMLYISHTDNKKYIMPTGIEVHPETTADDIIWIKPKLKKEIGHVQGSMGTYKTTYDPNKNTYKCTCFGYYRARMKGGVCKHIKALQEKNK